MLGIVIDSLMKGSIKDEIREKLEIRDQMMDKEQEEEEK